MSERMQQVTFHVDATFAEWAPDGVWLHVNMYDKPTNEATRVDTRTITVHVPTNEELIAAKVTGMRKRQAEIRVQAESECRMIEENIQKFLAITNEPSSLFDKI